jgi:acyl-CoA thioester hydrolase
MSRDRPLAGYIADGRHRLPLRVYFEDTDLTGIVYHANYLRFFERGRTETLRALGIVHSELITAAAGYYAVHDMQVTFHRPARLDDELLVITRPADIRAAACVLAQEIHRGAERLTSARITAAFLGPNGRPRRQPAQWRQAFTHMLEAAQD